MVKSINPQIKIDNKEYRARVLGDVFMKDKILFRGNRTDGKGWVFGSLLKLNTLFGIQDFNRNIYEVCSESIGQFVNSFNSYAVYSGDILETDQGIYEVVFHVSGFVAKRVGSEDWDLIEELVNFNIIGNTTDNPELLD